MMDIGLVRHDIKHMVDIGVCKAGQQNVGILACVRFILLLPFWGYLFLSVMIPCDITRTKSLCDETL
jgi:hypothetical protein